MKDLIFLGLFSMTASANAYPVATQLRPSHYPTLPLTKCSVEVIPDHSIGEIRLGMSEQQLKATHLTIHQGPGHTFVVGPYSVWLDSKTLKVRQISAEIGDLPDCIQFGKIKIEQRSTDADLAKIFAGCKKTESRYGGNLTQCDGLHIGTGGWGGKQATPALIVSSALSTDSP